jgi:hypothetical protein
VDANAAPFVVTARTHDDIIPRQWTIVIFLEGIKIY